MKKLLFSAIASILLFSTCSKDGDLNLFSVEDDIKFGAELDKEILANPTEYPILDEASNPEAYAYMRGMLNEVIASDEILYRDDFKWQIRIIDKDVMNAFAAPGGYLYFYTGIMKYLKSGSALAGVLAHEVAHADRRHSTETMTKAYGLSMLWDILLGNSESGAQQVLKDLALGASSLKFSRDHEYEADEYSVKYLNTTSSNYNPIGIRVFFDQLAEDGQTNETFEFLSTHPTDENRIANIMEVYAGIGSPTGKDFVTEHQAILSKLK